MAFHKWQFEIVEEVRKMQIMYKIAMRWTNMTICSAFMAWHENTAGAIGRARNGFQRFAMELLHAERELEPFAMFSDTISLQIARMKERKSWLLSCRAPEILPYVWERASTWRNVHCIEPAVFSQDCHSHCIDIGIAQTWALKTQRALLAKVKTITKCRL